MVKHCETSETLIIQNHLTSPSSSTSISNKSFSFRLKHLISRNLSSNSPPIIQPKIHKTQMLLLNPTDPNYIKVKSSFKGRQLSSSKVLGIFELHMPTKLEQLHEAYKRKLSKQTGENIEKVTHGMFHGTTSNMDCSFIGQWNNYKENGKGGHIERTFCENYCGLCGIIQHGNKTKYTRTKSLFKRKRMWFANDPCTSLYYCNNGYNDDDIIKSMFIVDVIEKTPKGILIVNKDSATLPRFLILFEMSGSPFGKYADYNTFL
ncbi:18171_t:CDS:2 [Funneliformis geosporum]|uniref:6765_t:CDS:1 n=1 Tax=Funneliformis geosporum TaxID=1117311 RepID=A0A9W4SNT2_9GLOM|nr:6765_t:CDS:2 [Funneliformis geosporum]CAI2176383.1 18171_t:CDS:2 [Funneliformis geosporum]